MKIMFWKLVPNNTTKVDICWVSARTMTKLHQDPENAMFTASQEVPQSWNLDPQESKETLRARTAEMVPMEPPPTTILEEYLKFCNVFLGEKRMSWLPTALMT